MKQRKASRKKLEERRRKSRAMEETAAAIHWTSRGYYHLQPK